MNRGQAHTLEAFMAALLLIAGITFALQATAVTPLSASTSNQHIQNGQRIAGADLLAVSMDNETLREAIVYWNGSEGGFENATESGFYTTGGPPTAFGRLVNSSFRDRQIAFNVYVGYWDNGSFDQETMVFMGSPSDNAVVASRSVAVYNDTSLTAPSEDRNVSEAWAAGEFYAPDAAPDNELFNVMEVRIVAWRM